MIRTSSLLNSSSLSRKGSTTGVHRVRLFNNRNKLILHTVLSRRFDRARVNREVNFYSTGIVLLWHAYCYRSRKVLPAPATMFSLVFPPCFSLHSNLPPFYLFSIGVFFCLSSSSPFEVIGLDLCCTCCDEDDKKTWT